MNDEPEFESISSSINELINSEIDEPNKELDNQTLKGQPNTDCASSETEISPTHNSSLNNVTAEYSFSANEELDEVEYTHNDFNVTSTLQYSTESSLEHISDMKQSDNVGAEVEEHILPETNPEVDPTLSPDRSLPPAALVDLVENESGKVPSDIEIPVVGDRQSLTSLPREASEVEEEDYEDEEVIDNLRKLVSPPDANPSANNLPDQFVSPKKNGSNSKSHENSKKTNDKSHDRVAQGPTETRGIGYLVEGPERLDPCIESRYPPSDLIYIRCLVRPFTVAQLTHMIESHFGKPLELWLDKIKSSAVVRMENIDIAKNCREGLDGCRWPSMNPRVLRCDYANEDLFSWLKLHGDSGERPPPRHLLGALPADKNEKKLPDDVAGNKNRRLPRQSDERTLADSHSEKRRKMSNLPNPVSDRVLHETSKIPTKTEEPAKALDDLFKRTNAPPSIYWLPLTKDEADSQNKLRIARFSEENSKKSTAFRRNQSGIRETRSPFASSAVKESTTPNDVQSRKQLESKEGKVITTTELPARKSSPTKTHRKELSPFTSKRRASPSPPSRHTGGTTKQVELRNRKSRSPVDKSSSSVKRRRGFSPSSPITRVENRYRRSPARNSPVRRDSRR